MQIRWAALGGQEGARVARPGWRRNVEILGRFSAHEHGVAFWVALWLAGLAAEAGAFLPLITAGAAPMDASDVVLRLVGGSFVACGLIAWRRRPDSRAGQLMTVAGFLSFVPLLLAQVHAGAAQTAAIATAELWTVAFVALLLTVVNGGRLEARVDRVLLGAFVVPLIVLQCAWLLFLEQPGNVLAVLPDAGIANAIDKSQRALYCLAALATGAVILARWRAASRPRRPGAPRSPRRAWAAPAATATRPRGARSSASSPPGSREPSRATTRPPTCTRSTSGTPTATSPPWPGTPSRRAARGRPCRPGGCATAGP
jgi:hypothetical protein